MFFIIGKGFGAYGYKPALDSLGLESRIVDRGESVSGSVVVAVPPAEQVKIALGLMKNPAVECLLLEKPLAPTPEESKTLLGELKAWGKKFRIGYLFSDCEWATMDVRHISWEFMADHYAKDLHNWKRELGLVGFYGIHILALLADMEYTDILRSDSTESCWSAVFNGPFITPFEVHIDSQSENERFLAGMQQFPGPFGNENRVQVLARSIKRFLDGPQPQYGKELDLWAKVQAHEHRFATAAD